MAGERKPKATVHKLTRHNYEAVTWRTACGLKLDRKARAETVLADAWEHVTCKTCRERQ